MSYVHDFKNPNSHHDPRWSAIDAYTISHLQPSLKSPSDPLNHALKNSHEKGLPSISCYPSQGKFFALQCRMMNVSHVLELGSLGGYSAIWFASASPTIRVTSVEINPKHAAVARENIAYAGLSDRVDIIDGAAIDVLPRLAEEIAAGKKEKFGFAFLDADKDNHFLYMEYFMKMCVPKAVVYVDNMVMDGELLDEKIRDMKGSRDFLEKVGKDDRVDAVVIQTVGEKSWDGFLMAVVS
ncbi:hypothetical protein MMC14_009563 [Varicellaria rhodocarpa]|nr:hypothetical protein [Varicellaria rhodocarpa]